MIIVIKKITDMYIVSLNQDNTVVVFILHLYFKYSFFENNV